jgi:hypothetical protein
VREPKTASFHLPESTVRTLSRFAPAALLTGVLSATLPAQRVIDRTGVGDTSIFATLNLPTPNEIRLGSGAPGPGYWQNRADYDIKATLDTGQKMLSGVMRMRLTNNSPVALPYIWVQVEQNAFRDGSLNNYVYSPDSRFGARGFAGGDVIDKIEQVLPEAKGVALKTRVAETVMKVDLAQPLAPGKVATIDITWHFRIPEHGADRMGYDGALFELAQWYPRAVVYDDVHGWNIEPYLGQGEFYLEYGDFNYEVTVPAGYIVAGTGTLQNQLDVLTKAQIARLKVAAKSDTAVHIVTQDELKSGLARPRKSGTQTWKFSAKNVRDVAWATSPDYLWDASGWKGAMAYAYYRPTAIDPWKDAADQARMSIMEYSERWFQYPYPQISAVEGPISGMEYPMLAMENHSQDKYDLYNVVTHEVGHNWFPMIVGSNERTHFWQDEGFNTFINYFSEARRYPEKGDVRARIAGDRDQVEQVQQRGLDTPIDMNPDRIAPQLLGINQYVKVAVALALLRDEVLGPAAFDDAFRTYVNRWAFRHPMPADFFRTMEDASGRRLDWFWREFFEENDRFDQAIDTVLTSVKGTTQDVRVYYGNRARGVLPIRAKFTFSDSSAQTFEYPAEAWSTNTVRFMRQYQFTGKTLVRIELDPEHRLIDINRDNNVWTAPRSG